MLQRALRAWVAAVAGLALAVVVLVHPSTAAGLYFPVAPMGM